MMQNVQRLESLITLVDERNSESRDLPLLGINLNKEFFPSVANVIGTDLSKYKVLKKGRFACNLMHVGRDGKVPVALYDGDGAIVSPAYPMFEVKDTKVILPEYLMLLFRRDVFDREATFYASAGIRGSFDMEDFMNVLLPVPPISEQRRIVSEYQTVERRIRNNEALIQKLEETAQAIYYHTFVEGIDEENLPEGWRKGCLCEVGEYVKCKIVSDNLTERNYISTENMLKDKKGIIEALSIPEDTNVTHFMLYDVLISNIRPYFKKIWMATFEGGCSNDVLCIRAKNNFSPLFLYQILFEDKFFDYLTASCQGTKMPRGDKFWIMNYPIFIPDYVTMYDFEQKINQLKRYINNIKLESDHLRYLLTLLTSKLSNL